MWEGLAGAENTSRESSNCLGSLEASAFNMSLVTKGEIGPVLRTPLQSGAVHGARFNKPELT